MDIETLLISDGYDENLLREIKKYISNYRLENVRILEYQPHQGVAYAKSLGIKNVKTNTFVFVMTMIILKILYFFIMKLKV